MVNGIVISFYLPFTIHHSPFPISRFPFFNDFAKLFFVTNENIENLTPPLPPGELESIALVKPTPDNPPWNSWAAVGVWLASIVFIIIFPNIFLGIYLVKSGLQFSGYEQIKEFFDTDINANILKIVAVLVAHVFTLAVAWLVVTKLRKFSFRQTLGWRFDNFKIWYIFVITAIILILGGLLVSYFGKAENDLDVIVKSSRTAAYLVAFLATFTAPLVEEVIYRGILYSAFQRSIGVWKSVALVTLLFALIHVPQYINDPVAISVVLVLSLILTSIRVYTKNLLPCVVLHFVFNGIQSLFIVLEPFISKYTDNLPQ